MNTIVDLLRYRNDLINHLGSLTTKIDVSEPLISLANLNSIHTNVSFSTEHIRNSFFALQEQIQEKNISVVNEIKKLINIIIIKFKFVLFSFKNYFTMNH